MQEREKQIEEMAAVIRNNTESCKTCTWYKEGLCWENCELEEDNQKICTDLYNAGYRKQSEWISVDDRLPELEDGRNWGNHRPRSIRVLCVCLQRSGKTFVKEGYYELFGNKPCWRIPGSIDSVTHWMPLPEAPKGGAE